MQDNDDTLNPTKPDIPVLKLRTPAERERLNRLNEFIAMKKRNEQLEALREAKPEPDVQTFRNLYFEYAGQRKTLRNWAKYLGLSYGTLKARYRAGKRGDALFCSAPYMRLPNTPAPVPEYSPRKKTERIRIKKDEDGTPVVDYDPYAAYDPTQTQDG